MAIRKVYIKVPILLECDNLNYKDKVEKKFNKDICIGINYEENLNANDMMLTLSDQHDIINKLKEGTL